MKIAIWRQPNAVCTPGICTVDGENFGVTLERPWLDNKRRESCIPAGHYEVTVRYSPLFRRSMLALEDVKGRDGILIHGANHWSELAGCIAISKERDGEEQVKGDLTRYLKVMVDKARGKGEKVTLDIVDPVGAV